MENNNPADNPFEQWIVALNNIDARLDSIEDWSERLNTIETKITHLEITALALAEIKERVRKIEEAIAKYNVTVP